MAMEVLSLRAVPALDEEVDFAAGLDTCVLVTAESLVLRRFVAHQIHQRSRRSRHPFLATTCGELLAMPEALQLAADGTLFCDLQQSTVDEQKAFLHFVGASLGSDVRLITGAPSDIYRRVEANEFNDDLYYRLNLIHVAVSRV